MLEMCPRKCVKMTVNSYTLQQHDYLEAIDHVTNQDKSPPKMFCLFMLQSIQTEMCNDFAISLMSHGRFLEDFYYMAAIHSDNDAKDRKRLNFVYTDYMLWDTIDNLIFLNAVYSHHPVPMEMMQDLQKEKSFRVLIRINEIFALII